MASPHTVKISPTILERVDAGADWLNENLPDWRNQINLDVLDLLWEETCILGQYNIAKYNDAGFDKALHAYFNNDIDRAVALGFLSGDFNYTELNAAWRQKITELNNNDENNTNNKTEKTES